VHHDVWDYDLAAQPNLGGDAAGRRGRTPVAAVLQPTKDPGSSFTLASATPANRHVPRLTNARAADRRCGRGVVVPATQPFRQQKTPPLVPAAHHAGRSVGLHVPRSRCIRGSDRVASLVGLFHAPSTEGTILYPFYRAAEWNWGGARRGIRNASGWWWNHQPGDARSVTLIPVGAGWKRRNAAEPGRRNCSQTGTPFGMKRELLLLARSACRAIRPPWGAIAAVDMKRGEIVWEVPPLEPPRAGCRSSSAIYGMPGVGGPMIHGFRARFQSARFTDNYLRAIDIESRPANCGKAGCPPADRRRQ
jgi:glucose dehydrogenase